MNRKGALVRSWSVSFRAGKGRTQRSISINAEPRTSLTEFWIIATNRTPEVLYGQRKAARYPQVAQASLAKFGDLAKLDERTHHTSEAAPDHPPARPASGPTRRPAEGLRDRDGPAARQHEHDSADVPHLHLDEPSQVLQQPAADVAAQLGKPPK
jgi:hypothetical protein